MRSRQNHKLERSTLVERVANLSSGNDDVLAPVLDAHRPVGVHDGQVAAMKVTTLESFLCGLLIREILQEPKELSQTNGRCRLCEVLTSLITRFPRTTISPIVFPSRGTSLRSSPAVV